MKKIILFLISISFILFLSSCKKNEMYSKHFLYFGTEIYIEIYSNSEENAKRYLSYADSFLEKYSKLSDRLYKYEGINNVYIINQNKGNSVSVSLELFDLIKYSIDKSLLIKNSENKPYFTIGIGELTDIYKDLLIDDVIESLPTNKLDGSYNTDVTLIELDKNNLTVKIPNDMSIDLGGVAKGYAVDLLKEYFNNENVKYTINAGSSTIITNIGNPKRKNNSYLVGLVNPDKLDNINASTIYGVLNIPLNKAVSTSGDYQSYFIYNNKRYSHIIDPYTNYSVITDIRSITVITDSNAYGDILSTTLYMMGSTEALKYANENNIDIIMFLNDSTILATNNIKNYVTLEKGYEYKR